MYKRQVPGIKITRSAQLLLDKLMQGDVSDISDIEDSDEEDSTAPVSYTHLDVYKRQV